MSSREVAVRAFRVECPTCNAPSGAWCITRRGEPTKRLHRPRIERALFASREATR